jgi:hypothetical protein
MKIGGHAGRDQGEIPVPFLLNIYQVYFYCCPLLTMKIKEYDDREGGTGFNSLVNLSVRRAEVIFLLFY